MHLEQLAGKRHRCLRRTLQARGTARRAGQPVWRVDVAAPCAQALDFARPATGELGAFPAASSTAAQLGQFVLQYGLTLGIGRAAGGTRPVAGSASSSARLATVPAGPRLTRSVVVALCSLLGACSSSVCWRWMSASICVRCGRPTVACDGLAQFALLALLRKLCACQALHLVAVSLPAVVCKCSRRTSSKARFCAGKPGLERVAACAQFASVPCCQLCMRVRSRPPGASSRSPPAACALSTAGARGSGRRSARSSAAMRGATSKGLEHVVAHKVGQVAHRLQRHGLVEQLQRLLAHVAEATAKVRAVGREAVKPG
jgi:hypothetical protein